ncbi:MAG: RNA-binding protein [Lentisphaerae bacterium]|nr:RNA-binding protein [Lentisphaerota bacterium]
MEIYVGNLPYSIKERELERAFGRYGRVDSVRIIKNKFNGKSKGFGFVEMSDHGEASEAVRALNGKDFGGRRIVVNEAKSEPRS